MFNEVESLVLRHPDTFGSKGAFAQAYSLFDAALGLATVAGPCCSGFLLERTNWQITAGTLAVLCAVGGLPVLRYTGKEAREERKERENGVVGEV